MHLHRPKPLHGWRDILLEIGVIVVGIVIAICLEQAVEFLHHNSQRAQLTAALHRDGEANRQYIADDIGKAQVILDWAEAQAATLERAGPSGPVVLHSMPHVHISSPDAGAWPSAKASGLTDLLPASAQNWLEYLDEVYRQTFESPTSATGQLTAEYAALDQVIAGRAKATVSGDIDLTALTAQQRADALERLRAIAERARGVLRALLLCDAGNEFILTTPLDQLDTPQSGDHYETIYRQLFVAHPAADFVFGGA